MGGISKGAIADACTTTGSLIFRKLAGMAAPQAKWSDFRARRSAPRRKGGGYHDLDVEGGI